MNKLYIILVALTFSMTTLKAAETKCETMLDKIDHRCIKVSKKISEGAKKSVGGFFGSLKKFSAKNETIGQTRGIEKKPNKLTNFERLKKFSKENKTISDTLNKNKNN